MESFKKIDFLQDKFIKMQFEILKDSDLTKDSHKRG